jgi:hypothetical protein
MFSSLRDEPGRCAPLGGFGWRVKGWIAHPRSLRQAGGQCEALTSPSVRGTGSETSPRKRANRSAVGRRFCNSAILCHASPMSRRAPTRSRPVCRAPSSRTSPPAGSSLRWRAMSAIASRRSTTCATVRARRAFAPLGMPARPCDNPAQGFLHGDARPILHRRKVVGVKRRHNDALVMFFLRNRLLGRYNPTQGTGSGHPLYERCARPMRPSSARVGQ